MLLQYRLLNLCHSELSKLQCRETGKFRLEILIIQLKRLLLDDRITATISGDQMSEQWFRELYEAFMNAHITDSLETNLEELIIHTANLKSKILICFGNTEPNSLKEAKA